MKKFQFDIKRFRFYLWTALAFLFIRLISEHSQDPDTFPERVINNIWHTAYIIVFIYLFFEYSIPQIGYKHILRSILLIAVHIFFFSYGLFVWRSIGISLGIYTSLTTFDSRGSAIARQMSFSMMAILFFGIVKHVYDYIKLKQSAQQLRIEKQQAELNYLKSQTNPHFLFNTLNNIYSLSRDKSDLAPESILRLSKILRFMLYETNGPYIAIEEELKIITDYIALEKLRYDESLRVNFNYDIEDPKQAFPPLLLIPLVENAFKHGVSETRNLPYVDIHLSLRKRQLEFSVKNSSDDSVPEKNVKENIGLSNLRRQLELLYTDYQLTVGQNDSEFTALLKINLSSHV